MKACGDMSALRPGHCRPGIILYLGLVILAAQLAHSAPVYETESTQVAEYDAGTAGCYYNFQHYQEGARIITNEPCLNCTCHNRMLMCYLRVCPFTKAIGQDCSVEKRPDQCCPVITCPEVPVQLLTSTSSPAKTVSSTSADTSIAPTSTELGFPDTYGCNVNDKFYADGAQLSIDSNNPCELCYCIRNKTTCLMQQCTLTVAGCKPVYESGICCPVKYNCEYDEARDTSIGTTPGLIMTTTLAPHASAPKCQHEDKIYEDGELIYTIQPCQHCYCFRGDIVCAVQECGKPMESHSKNCTALPPLDGECCPTTYQCEDDLGNLATEIPEIDKKNEETTQPSESFPGADNVIPEKIPAEIIPTTEKSQTISSLGNEVPESEPTKSSVTVKDTEIITTLRPESDESLEKAEPKQPDMKESDFEHDMKSSTVKDVSEISTESDKEMTVTTKVSEITEIPPSIKIDSSQNEVTTLPNIISEVSTLSNTEGMHTTERKEESITEHELVNDLMTKQDEEITSTPVYDEKILMNETKQAEKEVPEEVVTTTSEEAEKFSESSSPINNIEYGKPEDHVKEMDITTISYPEEIKNSDDGQSNMLTNSETSTIITDDEENKITEATIIPETSMSTNDEKLIGTEASISTESSTAFDSKENNENEKIDATNSISSATEQYDKNKKDEIHPENSNEVEKSEKIDTTSNIETSSLSPDQREKVDESFVSETSSVPNYIENETQKINEDAYESSTSATEKSESSEDNNIHKLKTTISPIDQESSSTESSSEKSNNDIITTIPPMDNHSVEDSSSENAIEKLDHKPTGIPIPDRVHEYKAEDKDAVTDNEVTEGYLITNSGVPHKIDDLQTEQPEFGPTTYLPPIDTKIEIDRQSSTPLYENPPKDNSEVEESTEIFITPKVPYEETPITSTEKSVIGSSEEPSSNLTPEEKLSTNDSSSTKNPEEINKTETPNFSELPLDDHTLKSIGSITEETSTNKELTTELDNQEGLQVKPDTSTLKSVELMELTTMSTKSDSSEIAVTEKIDENSTEKLSIDKHEPTDESITTVNFDVSSEEPNTVRTDSTESNEFKENPERPSDLPNISQPETLEKSTETSIGITETISNRVADKDKENEKITTIPIDMEKHESSTVPISTDEQTEDSLKETKLDDQNINQISESKEQTVPDSTSEINEPQQSDAVSTPFITDKTIVDSSTSKSDSTVDNSYINTPEKVEEFSHSTEPNILSSQTPEIKIETTKPEEIRPSHGIPGEGNCLVDGQSYGNNSAIPPANACQTSCRCVSSIVQCELIQCSPPPTDLSNCIPVYSGPGTCCPMYTCDSAPSVELEADNQKADNHSLSIAQESQTTQKSSEEYTEKTILTEEELTQPSTKSQLEMTEPSVSESDSNEKEVTPVSLAEKETTSFSLSTENSPITTAESETIKKSEEDKLPSPHDEKDITDKEAVDTITESTQTTVAESIETNEDNNSDDGKSPSTEISETETKETPVFTETSQIMISSSTETSINKESDQQTMKPTTEYSENSLLFANQTEKSIEDENIVTEMTVISMEPTDSSTQKIATESAETISTSTETPEKATLKFVEEESQTSEDLTTDKSTPSSESVSEKTSPKPSVTTDDESTSTASDTSAQDTSNSDTLSIDLTTLSLEKQEKQSTSIPLTSEPNEKIDESHEFTTQISVSENVNKVTETSTKDESSSSTSADVSETIVENQTDAVLVSKPENETSSTINSEESSAEKSEKAPATTMMPLSEGDLTTLSNFPDYSSEDGQSSSKKPTETEFTNVNTEESQSSSEHLTEDTIINTTPETVKEIETEISTENLPKEESTENFKGTDEDSQTVSQETFTQSTAAEINQNDVELKPTEQTSDVEKSTQKPVFSETTESIPIETSSETEPVQTSKEEEVEETTKSNVTEESNSIESSTLKMEQPMSTIEETEHPLEVPAEITKNDTKSVENEYESSTKSKIEEVILQSSSTTQPSKTDTYSEEQGSESTNEISSEMSTESEKGSSTEATIPAETSKISTADDSQGVGELTTPSNASQDPIIENDNQTQLHDITNQSTQGPVTQDEQLISEIPEAGDHYPVDEHPTDEHTTSSSPSEIENHSIDSFTSTMYPESSKPIVHPEYPDPHDTDNKEIFPPDEAEIHEPDADDYEDDPAVYGPGTCRYGGKIYMSAQQIPRDDACDFCFCFRSDIICLQQSCPPPIPGCHEEPIGGFCCPRYECPVSMATSFNLTTTTTTTTTTIPPHFLSHAYKGRAVRGGCQIGNKAYRVGEDIKSKSGPCMACTCGGDGKMKCEPRACSASPMLKEMIAHAAARKRRR